MTLEQFELAVAEHRDRVFGFALHFLGNRQEAEDVTQDVLVRLWVNRGRVDHASLPAWVLRVARNACVDAYRKRRTRSASADTTTDARDEIVAETQGADAAMDNRMLYDHIMASVEKLREPYKSIVILRELQEMSYEEIGTALELPLSTVKVYLHRGRRALRESLGALYGDGPTDTTIGTTRTSVRTQ